jgi:hypothetical protein
VLVGHSIGDIFETRAVDTTARLGCELTVNT